MARIRSVDILTGRCVTVELSGPTSDQANSHIPTHHTTVFLDRLAANDVVFFAGSGISAAIPSCLPLASEVLDMTARLVLPTDRHLSRLVRSVVSGVQYGGRQISAGIQPEVFFARLSELVGDVALQPWAVLCPQRTTVSSQSWSSRPSFAHDFIASYSASAGLPILTTNFDMLFEESAGTLGLPWRSVTCAYGLSHHPGLVSVWKLHGSIDDLATIKATMPRITRLDASVKDRLQELLRRHHLCFIGYSGRDLDLFPVLQAIPKQQRKHIFWIDPKFGAKPDAEQQLLTNRAKIIDAYPIGQTLDDIISRSGSRFADFLGRFCLQRLHPRPTGEEPARQEPPAWQVRKHLCDQWGEALKSKLTLAPATRQLFLALCLNAIQLNQHNLRYTRRRAATWQKSLPVESQGMALVLQAEIKDRLSDYVGSQRSAREACRLVRRSLDAPTVHRIRLYMSALSQRAMAHKLLAGPSVQHGSARFRLAVATFLSLCDYSLTLVRMWWWLRRAKAKESQTNRNPVATLSPPPDNIHLSQAKASYLEHALVTLVLAEGGLQFLRLEGVSVGIRDRLWRRVRKSAEEAGAAGTIGSTSRYLYERTGNRLMRDHALLVYELTTDPLNAALVHRDEGDRAVREGRRDDAVAEYLACYQLARSVRSHATILKARVGLAGCGIPFDVDELRLLGTRISGVGYTKYISRWLRMQTAQPCAQQRGPCQAV